MADQDLIPLLLQLLAEEKTVDSAISVDIQPQPTWEGQWQYSKLNAVINLPFTQRYDLAIVNLLNQQELDENHVNNALVRLRDLFAKKMIVLADSRHTKQLRALGMSQLVDVQHQNIYIWQFNILNYKHVPDWFNSKFWANPDNWDKYRW